MDKPMKEEAIKRLQILSDAGLNSAVRSAFEKDNTLYCSDQTFFQTLCYGDLTEFDEKNLVDPSIWKKVKDFEEKNKCLVYHLTHEHTQYGEFLDLFIVTSDRKRWNADKEDLNNGLAYSYVINLTVPDFSEFGTIGFDIRCGGLVRNDYEEMQL